MFNVAHRVRKGWSNKMINIEVELRVSFMAKEGLEKGGVISIKVYKEAKPGASFMGMRVRNRWSSNIFYKINKEEELEPSFIGMKGWEIGGVMFYYDR